MNYCTNNKKPRTYPGKTTGNINIDNDIIILQPNSGRNNLLDYNDYSSETESVDNLGNMNDDYEYNNYNSDMSIYNSENRKRTHQGHVKHKRVKFIPDNVPPNHQSSARLRPCPPHSHSHSHSHPPPPPPPPPSPRLAHFEDITSIGDDKKNKETIVYILDALSEDNNIENGYSVSNENKNNNKNESITIKYVNISSGIESKLEKIKKENENTKERREIIVVVMVKYNANTNKTNKYSTTPSQYISIIKDFIKWVDTIVGIYFVDNNNTTSGSDEIPENIKKQLETMETQLNKDKDVKITETTIKEHGNTDYIKGLIQGMITRQTFVK